MMRRTLALAVLLLALVSTGRAVEKERPLPKDLPPYGSLEPVSAPKTNEQTLPNGLTLWLVPEPGFPKVAMALAVRGGIASDPKDLPGLSNLLASAIDQGTRSRNARKIAEELQAAGGDLTASATSDALLLTTEVLASRAASALAVVADIAQNATFPDDEVELAKRNAAEALRAQEADPGFLAQRALAKALFGEHPYSVISGTQESIAKATPADLRREYAGRFRPDQGLLVVVGDFDAARMRAAVGQQMGKWTAPAEAPVAGPGAPSSTSPHAVFFIERQASVQTTFALGAFGPTRRDPEFAATEVANAIYGGMFGSRLVNNIREDKGYTYSPRVQLEARRATGVLQTRADVRNDVTGATYNEINYELNRMATTAPADEELARAKRYLVGVRALSRQARSSVARSLASLWVQGLPPQELGSESEKIQKVTAKDVEEAGRNYFPASRLRAVAVGEEKVIKEQLAPFGLEVRPAP